MINEQKVAEIRKLLSVPDDVVAVNVGSWGPLCRPALEAIKNYYDEDARNRRVHAHKKYMAVMDEELVAAREEGAKFINASPDEVCVCESTTLGMNIFLWGYDFQPGDEIISSSLENPAAKVPLKVIAKRKNLKLTFVDMGQGEKDLVEEVEKALSSKTKMILLSDVDFAIGGRWNLKAISQLAHKRGILVLADGVQAAGTNHIDVKDLDVDGYAIAAHKSCCGPDGSGFMYVKKDVLDVIHPTYAGVWTDAYHGAGDLIYPPNASRYEISTRAFQAIVGGRAALKWLREDIGLPSAYERIDFLRTKLWDQLSTIQGVHLYSWRKNSGALITFRIDGIEPLDLVTTLTGLEIHSRTILISGILGVRVAVGIWNRESDIDKITEVIDSIAKERAGK